MSVYTEIIESLYNGDAETVHKLVQQALDEGLSPSQILSDGLLSGMDKVGVDFKAGDLFVPEVLASARAMHKAMQVIGPLLKGEEAASAGTFVIGTVKGDLHDIGKSLVKLMLEGSGFTGVDLGIDVGPEAFAQAVREHEPDVLCMSALLTTTMEHMRSTIEALEDLGVREKVKVVCGGAPVTSAFTEQIGADGYAPDAARAVDVVRALINQ